MTQLAAAGVMFLQFSTVIMVFYINYFHQSSYNTIMSFWYHGQIHHFCHLGVFTVLCSVQHFGQSNLLCTGHSLVSANTFNAAVSCSFHDQLLIHTTLKEPGCTGHSKGMVCFEPSNPTSLTQTGNCTPESVVAYRSSGIPNVHFGFFSGVR